MDNLINITQTKIGDTEVNSVNARDIWKYLGSQRRFSNWIKDKISIYGFEDGIDYLSNKIVTQVPHQGGIRNTEIIEYIFTVDAAKELGMSEGTDKGREIRKYFIEIEKQWQLQNKQWFDARFDSKIVRKSFMDTVKEFVQMAKNQGSIGADYYYMNITKLIQKNLFTVTSLKKQNKNLRDYLNVGQLAQLTALEYTTQQKLTEIVTDNENYKLCYAIIKDLVQQYSVLVGQSYPALLTDSEIKLLENKKAK